MLCESGSMFASGEMVIFDRLEFTQDDAGEVLVKRLEVGSDSTSEDEFPVFFMQTISDANAYTMIVSSATSLDGNVTPITYIVDWEYTSLHTSAFVLSPSSDAAPEWRRLVSSYNCEVIQ